MTEQPIGNQTSNKGLTFRAVVIALTLMPVNTYFIITNEVKYIGTLATTMSLIYNVIISLTVLIIINALIKRFFPRFALQQGELMTIYMMLSLSSAIAGHDMMQTVAPTLSHGFWFATPENEWKTLFWRHLPPWLTLNDPLSLLDFYEGQSTPYTRAHLLPWLRPILWWTVLLTVLIWVMICMDAILRRQWILRERLAYPIVQLPLEMTRSDGSLFKSKMLWLGFAVAGGIDLINGLHVLFPAFPEIPVRKAEIGQFFTEKPWNAMGWTPLYTLPFGLGLGFLMPLEMSFSLWFFFLFWKAERILGRALGLSSLPGFPYEGPQSIGAFFAIACFALYGGRRYFISIFKNLWRDQPGEENEPMKYRWAVLGLTGGIIFLLVFSYYGGMTLWMAGLYFFTYYLLAIAVGRIRAEVGPPTNEMFLVNPRHFITDALGTRRIPAGSLVMMGFYYTFNRGYRAHPMPHTLEGFKVADATQMDHRRLIGVMVLATVTGILTAFWAYLTLAYSSGGDNINVGLGNGAYSNMRSWLYNPTETNAPSVLFMAVGFLFTGFLWAIRTRFPLWPFHPAGYAIASSPWTFGWLWFSVFVSWAVKTTVLKVGGIRLYRKALPFFLGLLFGEYLVGGGWVLIRVFWGIEVYSFYR